MSLERMTCCGALTRTYSDGGHRQHELGCPEAADGSYCCRGECCGPGSWCCGRAGPHEHDLREVGQ